MTKTIARAYAAQGIYAFAICPGFTMTGMAEGLAGRWRRQIAGRYSFWAVSHHPKKWLNLPSALWRHHPQ